LALAAGTGLRGQEPKSKDGVPRSEKEEDPEKDLQALQTLLNVKIISVSKVAQRPIDAPGVVGAISRDQITSYGWTSINDVLGNQPGFSPSQDYDRRTMSARGVFEGWNNNHMLVLVDGIPMNDNIYGTAYTWEVTPLFMAKNLEIMRGPGSALYGSNAVAGVVSINTVKAEDIQQGGQARLRFGDRATRSLDFLTGGSADLFSYVASYSTMATNGNEYASLDGSGRTQADGSLASFNTRDHRNNDYFFAKVEGMYGLDGLSLQFHQQRWSYDTGLGWLFQVPDVPESMNEQRQIFVIRYAKESGDLSQEYSLRYQTHTIDWNTRYYPVGTVYAPGLSEVLKTSADELFLRAQLTQKWGQSGTLVGGVEANRFTYDGDRGHYSNVDLNTNGSFLPSPDGSPIPLKGFLQWSQGDPVLRTAAYLQVATGRILNGVVDVTTGLRYDKQSSDYNALDQPQASSRGYLQNKLEYSKVSPRLGLVLHSGESYSFKVLVGRAFRTPSPAETFGANTYALASNIHQLQPETSDSVELASDWIINKYLNWRINAYQAKMKNLIGYSVANANLSTNLYTLTTRGLETELLWASGAWSGFGNLSYAKRVDEVILDPTILPSQDVTWVPALTANLGLSWKRENLSAAASVHYQGEVLRRASDNSVPVFAAERPGSVNSWSSLNFRIGYRIGTTVEIEAGGSNAFDQKSYLAKNFQYPFDYRIDPRSFWIGIRLK
jgi:iron complex outermembrane receptor protein